MTLPLFDFKNTYIKRSFSGKQSGLDMFAPLLAFHASRAAAAGAGLSLFYRSMPHAFLRRVDRRRREKSWSAANPCAAAQIILLSISLARSRSLVISLLPFLFSGLFMTFDSAWHLIFHLDRRQKFVPAGKNRGKNPFF
ncbi:hypothetical protein IKZ80_01500 [bacterium]|nr:hypothetical protein [bacterium]